MLSFYQTITGLLCQDIKDVAKNLGLGVSTLYRYKKEGFLHISPKTRAMAIILIEEMVESLKAVKKELLNQMKDA